MARKGSRKIVAPAAATTVLVAAHQIHLSKDTTLEGGAELTEELRKSFKLDDETVAGLVKSGALREVKARVAGGDAGDAVAAALARAEQAEQALAKAQQEIEALKATNAELSEKLAAAAEPTA